MISIKVVVAWLVSLLGWIFGLVMLCQWIGNDGIESATSVQSGLLALPMFSIFFHALIGGLYLTTLDD